MNKPGRRLHRIASRLFHPPAMDYVIGPALADLQLECADAATQRLVRRGWIYARAYLSLWKAIVVCACERGAEGGAPWTSADTRAIGGIFVTGAAISAIVTGTIVLATPFTEHSSLTRVGAAFDGNIALALALLAPQAIPLALPTGLLLGIVWGVRQRPMSRAVQRTMLAFGLLSSVASATMMEFAIPTANQAYRTAIVQFQDHRRSVPAKGSNELTLRELTDRIKKAPAEEGPSELRLLRLAYQGRLAFAATPLLFATLATRLAKRPRTRRTAIGTAAGIAAYVAYFLIFDFYRLVGDGTLSPALVAWTPNLVALVAVLVMSAAGTMARSSVHGAAGA